ncbi:hypothetical protein T35B1_18453 [Salinisphaera shabanensis T35B1]|uniref:ImmA/IrrE family metallo-endopeptidase n=1 Tax=Salinisphaera shabanensis TaxID=180542 RepID=UPI0033421F16
MHKPQSAEKILRQLSILTPETIDLDAIAWSRGAKVKYRAIDGCEACIHGSAALGRAVIAINNTGNNLRRRRFSLAHELGHWEWHRGRDLLCSKQVIGGSGRRLKGLNPEKVANKFAAELLMPSFLLKEYSRQLPRLNLDSISQLAEIFTVSRTAMAFRLVELEHEPSLLIAHGKNGRRWFFRSSSIAPKWFPRSNLDRHSSAYDILYNGACDDAALSEVDGDYWFNISEDIELYEQSFLTREDEVMTLLVTHDERMLSD